MKTFSIEDIRSWEPCYDILNKEKLDAPYMAVDLADEALAVYYNDKERESVAALRKRHGIAPRAEYRDEINARARVRNDKEQE